MRYLSTFAIALALLPARLQSQSDLTARAAAIREATSAGEHVRAVALSDSLGAWLPHHPNATFARAIAYASARSDAKAVGALQQLLRWDPRFARRAFQDSTLVRLRGVIGSVNIDSLAAA